MACNSLILAGNLVIRLHERSTASKFLRQHNCSGKTWKRFLERLTVLKLAKDAMAGGKEVRKFISAERHSSFFNCFISSSGRWWSWLSLTTNCLSMVNRPRFGGHRCWILLWETSKVRRFLVSLIKSGGSSFNPMRDSWQAPVLEAVSICCFILELPILPQTLSHPLRVEPKIWFLWEQDEKNNR